MKPKHFMFSKTQTYYINVVNTSSTSQPSTKQHIFTKLPVKCSIMVLFSKLKLLQKAGQLLDTLIRNDIESGCQNIAKLLIVSSDASSSTGPFNLGNN